MNCSIRKNRRLCHSAQPSNRIQHSMNNTNESRILNNKSVRNNERFQISRNLKTQQQFDSQIYTANMKFLIMSNSAYFNSKIKVSDKIRPNQYEFKIPTKTPTSKYKQEYWRKEKNLSIDNLILNSNLNTSMKLHGKFDGKTTYQNQYINKKNQKLVKKQKSTITENLKVKTQINWIQKDAPRYMQTQNKSTFLDWGGRNNICSMKPTHKIATTHLQFDGRTIYNNEFIQKNVCPTKMIMPKAAIRKIDNNFMQKKTSYASDFPNKQNHPIEMSFKPKNFVDKKIKTFKGASEYRSEFHQQRCTPQVVSKDKTIQQLQALIMQL